MKCIATIDINGQTHHCERNIGDEHFPRQVRHECKITDEDGKGGMFVSWATWRTVQPAAVPEATPDQPKGDNS